MVMVEVHCSLWLPDNYNWCDINITNNSNRVRYLYEVNNDIRKEYRAIGGGTDIILMAR